MNVSDAINRLKKAAPSPLRRLVIQFDAKRYVGTDETSGQVQLELLKREGCRPSSTVLEIGCGYLHVGVPLMQYLEKSHYVGVDPNEWLRRKAMKKYNVRKLVEEKHARFLSSDDFDASSLGNEFDFVFAHSVLSHCAHWQLGQFLRNTSKVLAPKGRILASIRLAEGNRYGSEGTADKRDSRHESWQYPGVTWFELSTIMETAALHGLTAAHIPEYTEFYTSIRPDECHDWIVFSSNTAD